MSLIDATRPLRVQEPHFARRDTSGNVLLAAGLCWAFTVAVCVWTALTVGPIAHGAWRIIISAALWAVVVLAALVVIPLLRGVRARTQSLAAARAEQVTRARAMRHRAGQLGWTTMGLCIPALILAIFALFLAANDHAVQATFFDVSFMLKSVEKVALGFLTNIEIAVLAEVFVLVWGLMIALARMTPGEAGRPIRWLATTYIDIFRAIPAIIVIYLIGFGLPLAKVPVLSDLGPLWSSVLALTLTYGAYVAEVYRSGIEGVHWSQVAAARSLGLSYSKSMRFVVIPQAVRLVMPPLLNDFIGLQKDTALVTIIGTVDAFTQAKIYAGNYFNLSSVTVVAILFIIITIPQTRFVDRLIERSNRAKAKS